jgi:hypothetical protein
MAAAVDNVSPYTISPNPATDRFTVSFEGKAGRGAIELIGLTGKEISEKVNITEGMNRLEIQIPSGILPGVYIVMVNGQRREA